MLYLSPSTLVELYRLVGSQISPAGLENHLKEVDNLKTGSITWELEQEIASRYGQQFLDHLKHWGQ